MKIKQPSTYVYPITIEAAEEGGFVASCPSLQGCHAEGETYGEVIDTMQSVIAEHVTARKIAGESLSSVIFKTPGDVRLDLSLPVVV